MKIADARWTKVINMLIIHCECSCKFEARSDRWKVVCPACGRKENLQDLRGGFLSPVVIPEAKDDN